MIIVYDIGFFLFFVFILGGKKLYNMTIWHIKKKILFFYSGKKNPSCIIFLCLLMLRNVLFSPPNNKGMEIKGPSSSVILGTSTIYSQLNFLILRGKLTSKVLPPKFSSTQMHTSFMEIEKNTFPVCTLGGWCFWHRSSSLQILSDIVSSVSLFIPQIQFYVIFYS